MNDKKLGPFTILKPLGKGAYAEVYLIRDKQFVEYAMKVIIHPNKLNKSQLEHLKTEIRLIKSIAHPGIVYQHCTIASKFKLYMIMDFIGGGNLLEFLMHQRLGTDRIRSYFMQLVLVMQYLHQNCIAHRDVKAENILLSPDHQRIYLSDFGLSAIYSKDGCIGPSNQTKMLNTSCGSPHYVAPEILKNNEYDGQKVDVWSCGVLLYLMIFRKYPFTADSDEQLPNVICKGQLQFDEQNHGKNIPQSAIKLIRSMLVLAPSLRPTFKQILEYDFINEDNSELTKQWTQQYDQEMLHQKENKLYVNSSVISQIDQQIKLYEKW